MELLHYIVDFGIIGVLILMSIISVATALERRAFYKSIDITNYKDRKELELELPEGSI